MAVKKRPTSWIMFTAVAHMAIATVHATDESSQGVTFFEKKVRPILIDHCYKCHAGEGKVKGGLRLDFRKAARQGGESGHAVIPGNVEKSLLIQAVRYKNDDLKMPPKRKLSDAQIADLEQWIKMGAPDPREAKPSAKRTSKDGLIDASKLWSLKPLRMPTVPAVKDTRWPRNQIDQFLLAAMERKKLRPVKDADIHRLVRRLYLTLIGLPPSAERMQLIVDAWRKRGPKIIEQLVDQMLASPRFGEKWGRHWLDLARYADTNVGSFHPKLANAWLYRNHVIQRFNEGMPFDQFIVEQIAGDLLPAESDQQRSEQLIATGFLGLSVRDVSERDGHQIILDGIDDQLETIGRSLLGLSIGCARCHDHKFDPITTSDYYALAGILRSSATTHLVERKSVFNGNEVTTIRAGTGKSKLPGRGDLVAHVAREFNSKELKAGNRISDMRVHVAGSYRKLGAVVPRGFIQAIDVPHVSPMPSDQSGRLQLAQWLTSAQNPLPPRVMANRIWYWLFGRGLVESVDDFGMTGRPPTHPELLDWLAVRLRDHHGWRIKPLIREIVLSRAWQLGAEDDVNQNVIDPKGVDHWRWRRRRLQAEQLHDSLLTMSGELKLVLPKQTRPDYEVSNTFNASTLKIPESTMRYRAVYLPVFRKDVPLDLDVLTLFNFPDSKFSSGFRRENTLPTQALFLLNSDRLHRTSSLMAAKMMASTPGSTPGMDEQRAAYLTLWIYGSPGQRSGHLKLVSMKRAIQKIYETRGDEHAEERAWQRVIHTMLISNRFMFIS